MLTIIPSRVHAILQPNLKWASNTAYICKYAYKNMWVIRRIKTLDMDTFTMLDYYMTEKEILV